MLGKKIYGWCEDLFPLNRSLTGEGNRQTLSYLKGILPDLKIKNIKSGTQVFDWQIPREWKVNSAYIITPSGKKICDFNQCNLHLVGYSVPINKKVNLQQLKEHLHFLPEQPTAIPYVTSYYAENWGFCLSYEEFLQLEEGFYQVVIDSELFKGALDYGELVIPGTSEQEVLISTYICHPSLANNELSGPTVAASIAEKIIALKKRRYTYRILFLSETIGAIAYLADNLEYMKKQTVAGFVLTCVGDNNKYSYLPSRKGETLADRAALHTLKCLENKVDYYSFLDRGSDERQYCSPNVDLPVCSIMRSKYGEYPEYHTSLDNLDFISPEGLEGAHNVLWKTIELIENNYIYQAVFPCEPQLGKRGLYPNISSINTDYASIEDMMNFLAYADGEQDLIEIADTINVPASKLINLASKLLAHGVIKKI